MFKKIFEEVFKFFDRKCPSMYQSKRQHQCVTHKPIDCSCDLLSKMHDGEVQAHCRRVEHNAHQFWQEPTSEHPTEVLYDLHPVQHPAVRTSRHSSVEVDIRNPEQVTHSDIMN